MLSSKFLKDVLDEAYPIIKRQLEDAEVISSFRDLVTANGGDWSALKALMKAHVQDSLDDSGDGKRVKKILEKADSSNAYADMLGLANMNEKNYSGGDDDDVVIADNIDGDGNRLKVTVDSRIAAILAKTPEPQPTKAAGSDLATPPANDDGQVADIHQPDAGDAKFRDPLDWEDEDEDAAQPAPSAVASKYPAPGVVIWESTPPEGVDRHDYSYAFGNLGQDIEVIKADMEAADAEPIVKIGRSILDGWARYTVARSQIDANGKTMDYSVVQYDGSDPLMDCIRWNLAGRILNDAQRRLVAQRLTKLEPKRKRDIFAAFDLGMELVA